MHEVNSPALSHFTHSSSAQAAADANRFTYPAKYETVSRNKITYVSRPPTPTTTSTTTSTSTQTPILAVAAPTDSRFSKLVFVSAPQSSSHSKKDLSAIEDQLKSLLHAQQSVKDEQVKF